MKCIFLILLLTSCGQKNFEQNKNKSFNQLTIKTLTPSVFEIENLQKTQGLLKISGIDINKRDINLEIGTLSDLKSHLNKLLTINYKFLIQDNSHDDRLKLFIKKPIELESVLNLDNEYDVTLSFSTLKKATKLLLITGDQIRDFGLVKYDTAFSLSGKELIDITHYESYFVLDDLEYPSREITKNYYRIYFHKDNSRVFNISQNTSFEDFLTLNNITHTRNIDEVNLLTTQDIESLTGWWYRQLPGGDYVLVYDDISNIHQSYLKSLLKVPISIHRIEGIGEITYLSTDPKGRILFKLNGSRVVRNIIQDSVTVKKWVLECIWFRNSEAGEQIQSWDQSELASLILNPDEAQELHLNNLNNGFVEVAIGAKKNSLSIQMSDFNNSVILGFYDHQCNSNPFDHSISTKRISLEKKFEIKGEAFLERRHLSF